MVPVSGSLSSPAVYLAPPIDVEGKEISSGGVSHGAVYGREKGRLRHLEMAANVQREQSSIASSL